MLTVLLHPTGHHSSFSNRGESFPDTGSGSHTRTPALGMPRGPPSAPEMKEDQQSSLSAAPAQSPLQESVGDVHNKSKVRNRLGQTSASVMPSS